MKARAVDAHVVTTFRVASFNIRNGRAFDGWNSWLFRRPATAEAIRSLEADVIGLQEAYAFQLRWLLRKLDNYDAEGIGRHGGRQGEWNPVLVDRRRARVVSHRTRWFGDTPDAQGTMLPGARFPRIVTFCTIELGAPADTVDVLSTHLDTRAGPRAAAAHQLATWLDPARPQVVVGDFNTRPDSDELGPLLAAGLRHALPADAPGTNHDFTGRTDVPRIDHILVNDHVQVVAAEVRTPTPKGRLPSDHWPVIADLSLHSDGNQSRDSAGGDDLG